MKKKESTATKPGLKNSQGVKKIKAKIFFAPVGGGKPTPAHKIVLPIKPNHKKKDGRGGARPGAGRKSTKGETNQLHVDMPVEIIQAIDEAGIKNKSAYIISLVANDLKLRSLVRNTKKALGKFAIAANSWAQSNAKKK